MMQFKIDENLHADAADLLRQHGHDALTVCAQGLRGKGDTESPARAGTRHGPSSHWTSIFPTSESTHPATIEASSSCD